MLEIGFLERIFEQVTWPVVGESEKKFTELKPAFDIFYRSSSSSTISS